MNAILDLTGTHTDYSGRTNITYNVSKFPDGQQTVDITSTYFFNTSTQVQIRSRMNDFKDLELILCATQALKNLGVSDIELYVPYFIGGRSDRLFGYGGVNYLKQVIGPIINSQGYSKVYVMDPHSDVLEAIINNFAKYDNFKLVKFALERIDNKYDAQSRICLVSPDAGAYKKIFDVAKEFGITKIATANKVRDLKTGNILKTELPNLPVKVAAGEFKYVIIDDICDGGRTFVELAKVIKEQRPNAKVYLVVTHGIFSKGLEELSEYFDGIFTTDTIRDMVDSEFGERNKRYLDKLGQLKVF
jgi:ribose-phosphate pyrophosphokinase